MEPIVPTPYYGILWLIERASTRAVPSYAVRLCWPTRTVLSHQLCGARPRRSERPGHTPLCRLTARLAFRPRGQRLASLSSASGVVDPLFRGIVPADADKIRQLGSTDTGDVSSVVSTVQAHVPTCAIGTYTRSFLADD